MTNYNFDLEDTIAAKLSLEQAKEYCQALFFMGAAATTCVVLLAIIMGRCG